MSLKKPEFYTQETIDGKVHTYYTVLVKVDPFPATGEPQAAPEILTPEQARSLKRRLIDQAIEDHVPPIDPTIRPTVKSRALDIYRGFNGELYQKITTAVTHAFNEATSTDTP